jgi:hypothetical protein
VLLLALCLWHAPASAQTVGGTDQVVGVLVCVPDTTGTLAVSQAPCPSSPISSLQTVSGVVLAQSDYQNLLSYDGPIDQSEAYNLALTAAGMVLALYLTGLGIGLMLRLIRRA